MYIERSKKKKTESNNLHSRNENEKKTLCNLKRRRLACVRNLKCIHYIDKLLLVYFFVLIRTIIVQITGVYCKKR